MVGEGGEQQGYYSAAATYRDQHAGGEVEEPGAFKLDRAVACSPGEFSAEWDACEPSGGFACGTAECPLMVDIMAHLARHRFFVIASGVVGEGVYKLYVLAQSEGVRVMIDVQFECGESRLEVGFRTDERGQEMVGDVVKCLRLKKIFGDFVGAD